MVNLLLHNVEPISNETFECGNCGQDFNATVITWVDVSNTPQARQTLSKWQFNIIQCAHCGSRLFSETPFFYEDFKDGLLIAVFPRVPEKRGEVETTIRRKYGYYPVLEFFYDMTQMWMLLFFQEHYKQNANLRALSKLGSGEERLRKILGFLKENPLMIEIRETLTQSFFDYSANERLMEHLGQAIYKLEEMQPWPLDHHCLCGGDLRQELACCNCRINIDEHQHLLSKHYIIYCPTCKEAMSGASCEQCSEVYTWRLGTVLTYRNKNKSKIRKSILSSLRCPRAKESNP